MAANEAVAATTAAMTKQSLPYAMLEALLAGTGKMRLMGEHLLPKFPNEDPHAYKYRLQTATLFPAYRRTVTVMAGKPFSAPLGLSKETPAEIVAWADNIDREGVSLHSFAAEMFAESFFGLAGILVDSPKVDPGRMLTVQDANQQDVRPYMIRVRHDQLLGWRTETDNGVRRLTQLRIRECLSEADGDFGEKDVEQVRVLTPGAWQIWRRNDKGDWVVYQEGASPLSYIPFVPVYGIRDGFMCGSAPLIDLAYANVKHWQSQSDQDNILHAARVPILYAKGFPPNTTLTLGASTAVMSENIAADLKWVEHNGHAIEAGQKSIEALEGQMIQSGAELMVQSAGRKTATEDANDAEGNRCTLQRMAEDFEASLDTALQMMADFASLPTGGKAQLYKDFGAATLSEASAQLINALTVAGIISKETAISELKRRGELAPEVDAADEAAKVEAEGGGLGMIGGAHDAPPMAAAADPASRDNLDPAQRRSAA